MFRRKCETGASIGPVSAGTERRPHAWLSFSKVQKIFPDESPKTLCTLVEQTSFSPSEVLSLVPKASVEALSKLFDLVEENALSQQMHRPTLEAKKEQEVPKADTKKSELRNFLM